MYPRQPTPGVYSACPKCGVPNGRHEHDCPDSTLYENDHGKRSGSALALAFSMAALSAAGLAAAWWFS